MGSLVPGIEGKLLVVARRGFRRSVSFGGTGDGVVFFFRGGAGGDLSFFRGRGLGVSNVTVTLSYVTNVTVTLTVTPLTLCVRADLGRSSLDHGGDLFGRAAAGNHGVKDLWLDGHAASLVRSPQPARASRASSMDRTRAQGISKRSQ